MRALATAEKDRMTEAVEESFNDTCSLQARASTSQDSFGDVLITYASALNVPCSFSTKPEYRNERGEIVTLDCDAVMRVSRGEIVAIFDKATFEGKTYEIDGVIVLRTAKLVSLKATAITEDDNPS